MNAETGDLNAAQGLEDRRFLTIGGRGDRRIDLLQDALARQGLPPSRLVTYPDLLAGRVNLTTVVEPDDIVRIESPGKGFASEKALLVAGADVEDPLPSRDFARIDKAQAERLTFDKGHILFPRQWYLGLCEALRTIEHQLVEAAPHRLMNDPADINTMFDKPRCHGLLREHGLPVPETLGPISCYDELVARMRQAGARRVFVKLAHGSSASGVVAYQTNGRQHKATTTVEMVEDDNRGLRLYNSRQIRSYRTPAQIAKLVDALCRHGVHVERWVPKAGIDGQTFDLRVVVIGGRTRHVVVRQSHSPMTNLHLLNDRGDLAHVQARLGPQGWREASSTCQRVMARCFPNSLYAGIDLLIEASFRSHAIAEVNAFGDLLPGIMHEGHDTYGAEIATLLSQPAKENQHPDGASSRGQMEASAP